MKPSTLLPLVSLLSASIAQPSRGEQQHDRRQPHPHALTHIPPTSIPGPTFFSAPGSKPSRKSKSAFSASGSLPESQRGGARVSGSNLTSVGAVFAIPSPEMPTSGPTAGNENGLYQASYWVGIDGVAAASSSSLCSGGGSLRAGVDTFWDAGDRTAGAWYEWYPSEGPVMFANFSVGAGDVVRITVAAAEDGTAGEVTVEKLLDGLGGEAGVLGSASWSFSGKAGEDRLCLAEVGWVIEDYPLASLPEIPLPLANFTEVVFDKLTVNGVSDVGALEVFDINLEQQGGLLTDCEVDQTVSVKCRRVVGGV